MVSGFPYAKLARIVRLPVWLFALPVIGFLLDYRVTFVAWSRSTWSAARCCGCGTASASRA